MSISDEIRKLDELNIGDGAKVSGSKSSKRAKSKKKKLAPAAKLAPTSPKVEADKYKDEGNQFYRQRKFDDAIRLYNKAWNTHKDITYLNNRLAAEIEKGDYNAALATCFEAGEIATVLNADSNTMAKTYARMGTALAKKGGVTSYGSAANAYHSSLRLVYNADTANKLLALQKDLEKLEAKVFDEEKRNPQTPKVTEAYTYQPLQYVTPSTIHKLMWSFRTKYRNMPDGKKEPFHKVSFVSSTPVPKSSLYNPKQKVLRFVLAHAITSNFSVRQYDVDLAALSIPLPKEEVVYFRAAVGQEIQPPPPGFIVHPLLVAGVTGIKHLERVIYQHFDEFFVNKLGFKLLKDARGLWVYAPNGHTKVIVLISGDDILVCGKTDADVEWFASKFGEEHDIQDLGIPLSMMGNEIDYNAKLEKVTLTRVAMTERLVDKYKRKANPQEEFPMDVDFDKKWYTSASKVKLSGQEFETKKQYYARLIADLMALSKSVRFDITNVVAILADLGPHVNDFLIKAAERVLDYVIRTKTMGVKLGYDPEFDEDRDFHGEHNAVRNRYEPRKSLMSYDVTRCGFLDWNASVFVAPESVSVAEITQQHAFKQLEADLETAMDELDNLGHFLLYGERKPTA